MSSDFFTGLAGVRFTDSRFNSGGPLPDDLRAIAGALSTVDPVAWAQQQVSIHRTVQRARRARWSEAAEVPLAGVLGAGAPGAARGPG